MLDMTDDETQLDLGQNQPKQLLEPQLMGFLVILPDNAYVLLDV